MPDLNDDLDWLYRRGRYAESDRAGASPAAGPSATTARAVAPAASTRGSGRRPAVAPPTPRPDAPRAPRRPGGARVAKAGRRPRILRWVLLVVLALVVYLAAVPIVAWQGVDKVNYAPTGDRPPQQPGTLLLLAGSDSREGLSVKETQELGTGTIGGNVADTVMLLYLPPSGRPALISLPRDSYVQIPGRKKNKLNEAYAVGGPKLLAATIEANTGLRVDGYVGIGFGGFVHIIDSLGGITQCPKVAIKDKDSHLDIPAGCQQMDGITALKYVRMRKADPMGDLGRVERQRGMVAAVAKKSLSPLTLINPVRYWNLTHAGIEAVKVGEGTSLFQLAPAGLAMLDVSKDDGLTLTVPIASASYNSPVGSAVQWNDEKAKQMFDEIARGDTSNLARFKR